MYAIVFIYYTTYTKKYIMDDNNNDFSVEKKFQAVACFVIVSIITILIIINIYIYIGSSSLTSLPSPTLAAPLETATHSLNISDLSDYLPSRFVCMFFFSTRMCIDGESRVPTTIRDCTEMISKRVVFYFAYLTDHQLKSNEFNEFKMTHSAIKIVY